MTLDDFTKILLSGVSLMLGALLTAVRRKLVAAKKKNKLHLIFYIVAGTIILTAIIVAFKFWQQLFPPAASGQPYWFGIVVIVASIVASIALIWFTKINLVGKYQYKTKELDPVVNNFTKNSDKTNIWLLAGDLNFFGGTPQEMDRNLQYDCLKNENFRTIQILCFKPRTLIEKIRYSKILTDMLVEIRYYQPQEADLNVRGRMKTLNSVTHLLIYNKVVSGTYEALELDTANANGALYNHIWNLIWQLAEPYGDEEREEYKRFYRGN